MPGAVILLDTSASMATYAGAKRRIDLLDDVLKMVIADAPDARVIVFNSAARELSRLDMEPGRFRLPEPAGSTALHLALELAGRLKPSRVVVISDGEPDFDESALTVARLIKVPRIDALYVGSDDDRTALMFMGMLSHCGQSHGVAGLRSLEQPDVLAEEIRLLLTGPG